MSSEESPFKAGIVDFNPRRMSPEEIRQLGIPTELVAYVGDWRQYPLHIAKHFPEKIGVSWINTEQPWYFLDAMKDEEHVERLTKNDVLILSGSGMSAYHQLEEGKVSEEFKEPLEQAQELLRNHLGEGKWILGICYGGQLAMYAIGAQLGRLPVNEDGNAITESGWLKHFQTAAGKTDPIMQGIPQEFFAPHLHSDFVAELPKIGIKIKTTSGEITVTGAKVLATRDGYLGRTGVINHDKYIQISVVEFDNGAKLYQIQPHPEMATPETANFLIRRNPWIAKEEEMGQAYYDTALKIPKNADFSVAKIIPNFVRLAREHLETTKAVKFIAATISANEKLLFQYLAQ